MSDIKQAKPGGQSWIMFIPIYLLSASFALIWFTVPPMLSGGTLLNTYFAGAQGPAIGHAMGQLGHTMSFVSMGALAAAILSSFIAKRIGVKKSLTAGATLITIAGLGSSLSGDSISLLLGMRLILGFGVGMSAVNCTTAISVWFPVKNRGFVFSIWGTSFPIGMLVSTNAIVNPMAAGDLAHANPHSVWMVASVISLLCLLLIIFVYKNPPKGQTEISTEAKPFREILPLFKQHQVWMTMVPWCAFNYMNYCMNTYNPAFFAGGFGSGMFSGESANMWGSIANATAIIGPLFGFLSDRIHRNNKYLLIALGVLSLTLSGVLGFKTEILGLSGWPLFTCYIVTLFIGNAILVAVVRPYIPLLVGRGGVTAVSLGLSLITILQYVGQMLSALFFGIITKGGGILPRAAGQPIGDLAGWASATWVGLVIPGTIALICCFFIKPKPHPFNPEGGHAYGTSGPGDHGPGGHDLPGGH